MLQPVAVEDVLAAVARMKALGVEAVAVCLLHSYANPTHEREIGEILAREMPDVFLSLSVDVLPQKREYERTSTTVINSYVGPPVRRYLDGLLVRLRDDNVGGRLMVMQSSGGMLDADSVLSKPAKIVECGPAAGVIGAQHLSQMHGLGDLITLDMGGTTAKASIIEKGKAIEADEYEVGSDMSANSPLVGGGGYILKLPAIDISEVGAGGGSIAWLDRAGALKIGPRSAGAVPGPACYGSGNKEPRYRRQCRARLSQSESLAGGTVQINAELASQAIQDRIAQHMQRALLGAPSAFIASRMPHDAGGKGRHDVPGTRSQELCPGRLWRKWGRPRHGAGRRLPFVVSCCRRAPGCSALSGCCSPISRQVRPRPFIIWPRKPTVTSPKRFLRNSRIASRRLSVATGATSHSRELPMRASLVRPSRYRLRFPTV